MLDSELEKRTNRLGFAMQSKLKGAESRLIKNHAMLTALSPFGVLDRGYSITSKNGRVIYDKSDISAGDSVDIRIKDAVITAEVRTINEIKE